MYLKTMLSSLLLFLYCTRIYNICCVYTNLVLNIHIHTKDGSDNDDNPDIEEGMISKLDHLVRGMCSSLNGTFSTVNMDNYYTSTTCAANLHRNGVLCQGTIRSSRKFVPKSILFSSSETRIVKRGTL